MTAPERGSAVGGRTVMDPEVVRDQRFLLVRRGYDPEAVEDFLDTVATALEELQARDDEPGTAELELAEARRGADEARTRATTHRLRAQRDVEALERTARRRRARLVAEIEELAAARDQLSTDLDRAVDVVDRVVQWVRRTDPGAAAAHATGAVTRPPASVEPTVHRAATDDADVGTRDPVAEDEGRGAPTGAAAEEGTAIDGGPTGGDDPTEEDGSTEDGDEGPDVEVADEADDEADDDAGTAGEDDPDGASPEDLAEALTTTGPAAVPVEPSVAAVREALRAVQDQVLANLRDRPRGDIEDWLPSPSRLDALDDAATGAAGDAFLDGWKVAGADPTDADGDAATAREALEEVRGAGDLPGLDVAGDLRTALEASLERGRSVGDPEVGLRERVAEVHRDLRQTRLPEAIETVLSAARHHGQLARWRHDGVPAVAWVVGQERRCPGRRCRGNATDGVVPPGMPFAFGDVVPPAHPGCTCTLRPAREDEELA